MPADRKTGTKPMKSERTHEENQERAYIAASRRSDRSLEARVESARRASEIHKKRTGKALRITEKDVMNEEMYEEEDDEIPQISYRNNLGFYSSSQADNRLHDFLQYKLMVQQAMGQVDPKSSTTGFQKYQFTNPQTFSPYMLTSAIYAPVSYQGMHPTQQFFPSTQHTVKPPAIGNLMNRFHPYAKPNTAQKRQYPTNQSPAVHSRYQTPVAHTPAQLSQASQVLPSPATPPVPAPQKAQAPSPVMSQSSNMSPNSQVQTPTLTHSSAGSTPTPTAAEPTSLSTSPVATTAQSDTTVVESCTNNPLSSAFSSDVQTFLSPTYMSSMLHGTGYKTEGLDFLKALDTPATSVGSVHQPQFTLADVFDTSVFNAAASLTNTKGCPELQHTSIDGYHYHDVNFDGNALFGLDQVLPQPQSDTIDLVSPTVPLNQLKTPVSGNNAADFFNDTWLLPDSITWPADESFWSPLTDFDI